MRGSLQMRGRGPGLGRVRVRVRGRGEGRGLVGLDQRPCIGPAAMHLAEQQLTNTVLNERLLTWIGRGLGLRLGLELGLGLGLGLG